MKGANPSKCCVLRVKVEDWINQLDGSRETNQHANKSENNGGDHKRLNDLVVVTEFFDFHN